MAISSSCLRGLVISLLLLAGAFPTSQAQDTCTTSIYDAVSSTPELSKLKTVIELAGLKDTFSDKSLEITALAPNDSGFSKLETALASMNLTLQDTVTPDNKAASILLYHGIPNPVLSKDLQNGATISTLLTGYNLTVDTANGPKFVTPVNSASVVTADIKVCKSVVHIISDVLLPANLVDIPNYNPPAAPAPQPAECTTSLYDAVTATKELEQLKTVIDAAGLKNTFSDKSLEITVLGPNNKAFENLVAVLASMNLTLADTISPDNKAASILLYHGIPSPLLSTDLKNGTSVSTLLGTDYKLTVDTTNGVKFRSPVNFASVVTADVKVCKNVVHIIDAVLLPAQLSDIPNYVPPSASAPAPSPGATQQESIGNRLGSSAFAGFVATTATFIFSLA
ncbi:hypothetical protein R1sor_020827 [Riccia sorocarpa]|uniref:FAS1 domain-containing protein n=1 Tax=Riccia sorocarpa TaxID=122646 RepID=A0ABD3GGR7_9MARC